MTMSSLLPPLSTAAEVEPRSALVAVAPAALSIAVVLVLLTAIAVVALVREVRRDGYGLERPRVLAREFPWQTEPIVGRSRAAGRRRRPHSWSLLRTSGAAHR